MSLTWKIKHIESYGAQRSCIRETDKANRQCDENRKCERLRKVMARIFSFVLFCTIKVSPGCVEYYSYRKNTDTMDGEKATDGGLERGSHPLFAAVIAVGEGDIMAITGISYGRTSCMRHRRE